MSSEAGSSWPSWPKASYTGGNEACTSSAEGAVPEETDVVPETGCARSIIDTVAGSHLPSAVDYTRHKLDNQE